MRRLWPRPLWLAPAAILALALAASLPEGASAQTFHYSHGWTNGKKRADVAPIPQQQKEGQEQKMGDVRRRMERQQLRLEEQLSRLMTSLQPLETGDDESAIVALPIGRDADGDRLFKFFSVNDKK